MEVPAQLLLKLLHACIDAMTNHAKKKKGFSFGIGLACLDEGEKKFHVLKGDGRHKLCKVCEASNFANALRQHWTKAAEQVSECWVLLQCACTTSC